MSFDVDSTSNGLNLIKTSDSKLKNEYNLK